MGITKIRGVTPKENVVVPRLEEDMQRVAVCFFVDVLSLAPVRYYVHQVRTVLLEGATTVSEIPFTQITI